MDSTLDIHRDLENHTTVDHSVDLRSACAGPPMTLSRSTLVNNNTP